MDFTWHSRLKIILFVTLSVAIAHSQKITPLISITPIQSSTNISHEIPFEISCPDKNQCHDSVAAIVDTNDRAKFSFCTGFLVTPEIMATNRHCMKDQYINNLDCSGLKIRFPATLTYPEENQECDKVLTTSDPLNKKVNTDFAFVKLKSQSQRPLLKISQQGFQNGEKYKIFKMNIQKFENSSDENKYSAKKIFLESSDCRALQRTIIFPEIMGDFHNIAFFNPCKVIGGNSGSPLIGSDGNVRGLISNSFLSDESHSSTVDNNLEYRSPAETTSANINNLTVSMFSKNVLDKVMENSGYGTNLGCINLDIPGLHLSANKKCQNVTGSDQARKSSSAAIIEKGMESVRHILNTRIQDFLKTLSKRGLKDYVWTYDPASMNINHPDVMDLIRIVPRPVCWMNQSQQPKTTILPVYFMRLTLNSELQYQTEFIEVNYKYQITEVRLNPKTISNARSALNSTTTYDQKNNSPPNMLNRQPSADSNTTAVTHNNADLKIILKTDPATTVPFGIPELARPLHFEAQVKRCALVQ